MDVEKVRVKKKKEKLELRRKEKKERGERDVKRDKLWLLTVNYLI